MAYHPIEQYGLIGNMRTAALVGQDGSIDWLCLPQFDSPSVFAAILDEQKGGRFRIAPQQNGVTHKQFYWPDTNILVTRFLSDSGVGQLIDFMALGMPESEDGTNSPLPLVRRVQVVRGRMTFQLRCHPAFNYARDRHRIDLSAQGATFHSPSLSLSLVSPIPLQIDDDAVGATFTVREGETLTFILHQSPSADTTAARWPKAQSTRLFDYTVAYWRKWLSQCTYTGRWREMVHRSCLTLKLLTFEPTGAIVAAPTCSLPETLGSERNWDYRYTWIRDAAFTLYALLRVGFTQEAAAFMKWLDARCQALPTDGALQIMYSIDGKYELTEETLAHLEGYKGSRPVRIGNGAHDQLQLDIYGELLDSVYLFNKYGAPVSYDLWTHLRHMINWVCDNWQGADEGIWETRGGRQHFVYSKLMCWVAVDRGLRLADKRSFPADREHWLKVRDAIYEDLMQHGWSDERQAFVQHYGSDHLDAATLMMPLVFFVSPDDPRMLKTLDAIMRSPKDGGLMSDGLIYRYNAEESPDGLSGQEGTFNICTFWLVEALTRAGRTSPERLQQGRLIFEQMLGYANHLGLYAEQTGHHGEALGNFPQAFTHLAVISSAFNLDRAL
ncbi:MAG: glycoside hydrolase family 15 protein [Nitrospiraceae bacterium]